MCGICGLLSRRRPPDELEQVARAMASRLAHRGPDSAGVWVGESGVALGHRRLRIIDLSDRGHQPMPSPNGRWVLCYNGEIYNHPDIRRELSGLGYSFRGSSDSEVLASALEAFGPQRTVERLVGMFAFAAWDIPGRRLVLARDRLGQKPLFYGLIDGELIFGSELSVLNALPARPPLDPEAMALMLRYKMIPAPFTIYQGFRKLPPGCWTTFEWDARALARPIRYWRPRAQPIGLCWSEAKASTAELLDQAVAMRMMSDVPLGAFLSGGIDSSLVVSLMQRHSTRPVRTFTVGYEDRRFNEADQAARVARHLGTEHTELLLTERQALELVPRLGELYDEPFGDSSQIPALLLSRLTREHVTVALSGDGGDEAFAGYNRHVWLPRLAKLLALLPAGLRHRLAGMLRSSGLRSLARAASDRGWLRLRLVDDKLDKLATLLAAGSLKDLYRAALSDWKSPGRIVGAPGDGCVDEFDGIPPALPGLDQLCLADSCLYLPDDILVKVDRASMAWSLEARAPFLDHRLFEHALSLDGRLRVRGLTGKFLLRELLAEHLPRELFTRPKMGFAVPIQSWLRHELRDWAEGLLATLERGPLDPAPVKRAWTEHLCGRRDRHHQLWNVLMLLSWMEANRC